MTRKRTWMKEECGNFIVRMKVLPYKQALESNWPAQQRAPLAQAPTSSGASGSKGDDAGGLFQPPGSGSGTNVVRGTEAPFTRRVPWP